MTASRIGDSRRQLQLLPGAPEGAPHVSEVYCTNQGRDSSGIIWECSTNELPILYVLGKAEVSCEGWDGPGDEYVVRDSCLLRYEIIDNPDYARYARESRRRERALDQAARYEEEAAEAAREAARVAARWAKDAVGRWARRPWWGLGRARPDPDDFGSWGAWGSWEAADPATASAFTAAVVVYRVLLIAAVIAFAFYVRRRMRWCLRRTRRALDGGRPRSGTCVDECANDCCDCCVSCCGACCAACCEGAVGAVASGGPHVPPSFFGPRWLYPHSRGFYFNQACGCPACREYYLFPERRAYHTGFWGRPGYDYSRGLSDAEIMAARELRAAEREAKREARQHEREAARLRREAERERQERERTENTRHRSTTQATTTTR